jgi:Uma2 family endonuclease
MAMAFSESIRPLKRSEYEKLVSLGAFADERLELLEGALVEMSPNGPPHFAPVQKLTALLVLALLKRATVRIQGPFAASDTSEPEPDVAIVPLGEYDTEHAREAYLIIEVADSSLERDRGIKQRIYAASRVPEYWIVNVRERTIEVHREPGRDGYARVEVVAHDGEIALLQFPDVTVRVRDVVR